MSSSSCHITLIDIIENAVFQLEATLSTPENHTDFCTLVSPVYDLNMLTVTSSPAYLSKVPDYKLPIRIHHPWNGPYHMYERSAALVNAITAPISRNGNLEQSVNLQHSLHDKNILHRSELLDGEPDDDTITDRSRHDTWNKYFNDVRSTITLHHPSLKTSMLHK
jgi:hypothetical protein